MDSSNQASNKMSQNENHVDEGLSLTSIPLDLDRESKLRPISVRTFIGRAIRRFVYTEIIGTFLGIALMIAAAAKSHQLFAEARDYNPSTISDQLSRFGVVEFELFLSLWLLTGFYRRASWGVALCTFCVFAVISLITALSGKTSCGCFGKVPINPWFTFAFDVFAGILLGICRPRQSSLEGRQPGMFRRPLAYLAVLLLIAFPVGLFYETTRMRAGSVQSVAFVPENSIGERLPLLDEIETSVNLNSGKWLVLFHRSSCSLCQDALFEFRVLARDIVSSQSGPRVVAIECPPFSQEGENDQTTPALAMGRISERSPWMFSTPMVLLIENGTIEMAFRIPEDLQLLRILWSDDS